MSSFEPCGWCSVRDGAPCECPSDLVIRSFFRGDVFQFMVTVEQIATTAPDGMQPVIANIAGWNFWLTAKYRLGDPDALAAFQIGTETVGVFVINPNIGQVIVTVPSSATIGFPARDVFLWYDLKSIDAGGNAITIEVGKMRVRPQATRRTS